MALRRQVINLVGPNIAEQPRDAAGGREVGKVQVEPAPVLMKVRIDIVDATSVETAGAPLNTVHFISLGKKKLGKIRAVLARHPCDQRSFHLRDPRMQGSVRRADLFPIPANGRGESGGERHPGPESEILFGPRNVQTAARLAIRLAGIPNNPAIVTAERRNCRDEVPYGDLLGSTQIHRLCAIVPLRRQPKSLGRIGGMEKGPRRGAIAPADDLSRAAPLRLEAFADQGGNYMGCLRIEIIARAVQIDRQKKNRVHAVLRPIGLALHEQGFLGDSVGGIRLLRITIPEGIFAEGHRRELRVGTGGPDHYRLLHIVASGVLQQLDAHNGIIVKEASRITPVCADAPYYRREMEEHFWSGICKEPLYTVLGGQVVIVPPGHEDISTAQP